MKRFIVFLDRGLTGVTYAAYIILLIYIAVSYGPGADLIKVILVPASGFLIETIIRERLDFKRPYEVSGRPPLIPKETRGKSFPSRHAFSVTMIAVTYLFYLREVGIVMLMIALALCVIRVAGGVHFVRDVIAGAALAAAYGVFFMMLLK